MTPEEYSSAVERVRAESSRRRSVAWAAIPERVLGLPLRPITPATFALLHGTRNAFVCGTTPVLGDVQDFILFHAPEFDPDHPTPRFLVRWRIALRTHRALCPLRVAPPRRAGRVALSFLRAIEDIRAIITDTWADALPGRGEAAGAPLAAALPAQMIDLFAREYCTWPLTTPVRHTPIKQLFQLARCSDRHHLGRRDTYHDAQESALVEQFLAAANREALARAASNPQPSAVS